jgi:glycosyltransferase involved in cell wall biosynthesis
MRITVAICTWNRCRLLAQTLEQMTRLRVPGDTDWELLIVNNNCTDATREVIRSYSHRLRIREIVEKKPGLSHARNCALAHAKGDYILWTDDDVRVDEGWLTAFSETAARYPNGAVFGGPIEPWFPVTPDPEFLVSFPALRTGFCGVDHGEPERYLGPEQYVWGANMAFRRAAVDGLLFDPALGVCRMVFKIGEEKDFIQRVRQRGGSIVWSPAMRVQHYIDPSRMTRGYLKRRYTGHGRTSIRKTGIPPGVRLFGAPSWLWRQCLVAAARFLAYSLAAQRIPSLLALR